MKNLVIIYVFDSENDSEDPVVRVSRDIFRIPYPYPWQRLIIAAVLDAAFLETDTESPPEPLRRIAVLPTGAGKSLCWMLPASMIKGLTIAVFPLLSLMADQERRLKESGIKSVTLRGGQDRAERRNIWALLDNREVKIVLANPEVLQVEAIARRLREFKPAFLVVDETHTVSQWGESFRPACAGMGRLVEEWNPQAVLALTATAGPHIRNRITELLFNGEKPTEALADPDRPSIRYGVIPSLSRNHVLERLVREEPRPMVVFGSTRSSVEMAARMLRFRMKDDEIRYYHAGLSREEKSRLEEWFLGTENGVLCATCAYGMGVDKSNVRTVVHLAPPSSVEAYLQESGRASRDGKGANAWLIYTPEDVAGGNKPKNRIGGPSMPGTTEEESIGKDPSEVVARSRRATMIRYANSTDRCRREMLLYSLGIEALDCGGCDVCGSEAWQTAPEESVILRVLRWNRSRYRKGEMARILVGRRSVEIRRKGLDLVKGFRALNGWELEDVEEAIGALVLAGKVYFGRRGRLKGRLHSKKDSPDSRSSNSNRLWFFPGIADIGKKIFEPGPIE